MTIHHDKLAYGKLAPQSEEMKEDELLAMLSKLNEEEGEETDGQTTEKDGKNNSGKLKKL